MSSDALKALRDRRERADVAEEQRQLTLQAAELEGARHFRKPRHHRGRDKPAKGGTDRALLMAFHRVERRDAGKIDRCGGKRRIGRLDQQSVTRKREPAHRDDRAKHGGVYERGEVRPQDPCRRHEHRADQRRRHPLRARSPIRPRERLAAQELFDDLRMGFNARHRGINGVATMSESSAAEAPKNTILPRRSLRSAFGSRAFQAGIVAARVGSREIDPDVSGGVRRDRQVAVADRHHAVRLVRKPFRRWRSTT